jgi:chaperonin GroES
MAQTDTQQDKKSKTSSSSPQFRPLGNRVLVKRLVQEEKLKGGILLPDNAKKKQEQAEVVAVGSGKTNSHGKTAPMPVKVGDVILMEKYSGQDVTLNHEEYVIVSADDIIAIVE